MRRLLMLLCLMSSQVMADGLVLRDGWVRAMPPGSPVTAGFISIYNGADTPRYIVSATSPDFGRVELHETVQKDGVMAMEKRERYLLPAKKHLVLKPGAKHMMMFDAKRSLKIGDEVNVEFILDDGEHWSAVLPVKMQNAMPHEMQGHDHHNH